MWLRVRKEYKKLKKNGFDALFTKKQLKCLAELIVRQQDVIIIN